MIVNEELLSEVSFEGNRVRKSVTSVDESTPSEKVSDRTLIFMLREKLRNCGGWLSLTNVLTPYAFPSVTAITSTPYGSSTAEASIVRKLVFLLVASPSIDFRRKRSTAPMFTSIV